MTYQQWLRHAAAILAPHSPSPRCDAELLLSQISQQSRATILAFSETVLGERLLQDLTQGLHRRQRGEPMAYIIGQREFWSLPLRVTPDTLIPRPETELLVEHALRLAPNAQCQLLDLGTGSGAIALALAKERPDCQITAVDCSQQALRVAQQNAQQLQLPAIRFLLGNWFDPLHRQQFSLIVSNPPYLDPADPHLQRGDICFEPTQALVAAEQGLADLRQIIQQATDHLLPMGWLLLEHGWQQSQSVTNLFHQAGYRRVETFTDLAHHPRLSLGQWQNS